MDNLPIPQSRIEELMNAFISRDSSQISTPQSRIEEFWYHLIEGTNALPIPQSRIELLLKKIIENDTKQIPLAKSRAEEFLVSILTGDINKLPIPQSRSEYYLDYIARNNLVLDDIEYVKYSDTNITASNTVQKPFRSAILMGSTKYRDIDTGEVLDNFEDGRNLELVPVRMPVLTTTGKNLFNPKLFESKRYSNTNNTPTTDDTYCCYDTPIEAKYGDVFRWSTDVNSYKVLIEFDENGNQVVYSSESIKVRTYTVRNSSTKYIKVQTNNTVSSYLSQNPMLEKEPLTTTISYEPYKSNILTVNEDVTLRSNGSVCDELDLLTGKLTQRIDEDGEILVQEVVKTVDLKVVDQDDNPVKQLSAFDETTHIVSSSASDNSLIAIAEVEVPTKLIEALDNIKLLSSDVGMLIDEVDAMQKTQDENSTMTMSAMTELYEIALMMGGNS